MLQHLMTLPLDRFGDTRDIAAEAAELKRLRKAFGRTQVQMAIVLDVNPQTYHRWERGKLECPLMALELMRCWAREVAGRAKTTKKK